ncbi:MAG: hypothetical protein QF664_10045 [Dehalococcoidia bacterium]|jgi:hypothetical protein|nr:hypothetical protein [Dehalococcoidia bacterium]
MSERERRSAERRREVFPVSVATDGPIEIEGQSLDVSTSGLLLTAGRIVVQLRFQGKQYRGQLVRAFPMESGETAFGIKLDEA